MVERLHIPGHFRHARNQRTDRRHVFSLITGYAKAILKNCYVTLMVGGILTILYAYLCILLQLEDYALLMGSLGLFLVLSVVMYLTRKVGWYAVQPEHSDCWVSLSSTQPTHCFKRVRLCPRNAITPGVSLSNIESMFREQVKQIDESPLTRIFLAQR